MAFDDERSDIQMAVRSLDESNRLFAVEVDMENRSRSRYGEPLS